MLSFFVDILDEIDDIIISSILLSVVFSFSIEGFSLGVFYTLFILFLVYLTSKIIFLKVLGRVIYADHVEFMSFESEKFEIIKEGIENYKAAIVFRIFDLIRRFSPAFSAFLSFASAGFIKVPFYGKISIEASIPQAKEKVESLKEKSDISCLSIIYDILFSIILLLFGIPAFSVFILIAICSLIPMISSEGTNIITFSKILWILILSILVINYILSFVLLEKYVYVGIVSIILILIILKLQKA